VIVLAGLPPLLLAVAGMVHPGSLNPGTAQRWHDLHVLLLLVFPLLAVGPWLVARCARSGVGPVLALLGYGYAVCYTALDVLAGIGAGAVQGGGDDQVAIGVLFHQGDVLARVGTWCYLALAVLAGLAVLRRAGPVALVPAAAVVAAAVEFRHSHIFYPRGVAVMGALAAGWAVLAWLSTRADRGAPI
jgi:hypothetical protein